MNDVPVPMGSHSWGQQMLRVDWWEMDSMLVNDYMMLSITMYYGIYHIVLGNIILRTIIKCLKEV